MRGRALFACLAVLFAAPAAAAEGGVLAARYTEPTERYSHGVLGDAIEYGALEMRTQNRKVLVRLPDDHVFEDLVPRLADIDGDGENEVIVVETDMARGAALAIYDETGKRAETPHIGEPSRWLAPVGAADLDGDGFVEIAYVDRPHLAKVLRVWRYRNGSLSEVAQSPGLSNHRIGEDFISGGIRNCGSGPELVTANAGWTRIMATRLVSGDLQSRDLGDFQGRRSFARALSCRTP